MMNWPVHGRRGRIKPPRITQMMRENTNRPRLKEEKESIPSSTNGNTISQQSKAKQTAYVPARLKDTLFLPAKLESQTNLFWV